MSPPARLADAFGAGTDTSASPERELKVVQEMLGHGSIVLTADTYASFLPEVARTTAERPPRT